MTNTPLLSFTFKTFLDSISQKFASHPALRFVDEPPITYRDLKEQTNNLSQFLFDRGITHGDRVAIIGENSPNWGIAYLSITSIGAIVVPILPEFNTTEIQHILRHSEAKTLFVSQRYYFKIEEMDRAQFTDVILLDSLSIIDPNTSKEVLKKIVDDGSRELRRIAHIALRFVGLERSEPKTDDVAAIIYTSGTTGHSKGVMLTHYNILANAQSGAVIQPLSTADRTLSVLPLAHVYECTLGLFLPLLQGACIHYLRKPPTAQVLLPALESVKPTIILSVPLIIEKIYKARILPKITGSAVMRGLFKIPVVRKRISQLIGKKLLRTFGGQLKFFGVGGAALAPDVEFFLREAGFPYAIGYGLTETSPLAAGSAPAKTKYRAIGPAAPNVQVRIADPDPNTGIGEIQIKGSMIMKGYFKDPEKTAEVMTTDGWFKSGDLGLIDEEGYLFMKGRLKNMILGPSGENIYPEAIESVINRNDLVLESLVFQQGTALVARIHPDYEKIDLMYAGMTNTQIKVKIGELLESIRANVNATVSSFSKLASVIEQTEPFEKTPTQKIKRYLYTTSETSEA